MEKKQKIERWTFDMIITLSDYLDSIIQMKNEIVCVVPLKYDAYSTCSSALIIFNEIDN